MKKVILLLLLMISIRLYGKDFKFIEHYPYQRVGTNFVFTVAVLKKMALDLQDYNYLKLQYPAIEKILPLLEEKKDIDKQIFIDMKRKIRRSRLTAGCVGGGIGILAGFVLSILLIK